MHSAPDTPPLPTECVVCGESFDDADNHWFVRGDEPWAPRQGFVHTRCIQWDERPAPWPHLLREIPKEIERMLERVRHADRALRALRKLHREWPRDGAQRVGIVERLLREWRKG